MGCMRYFWDIVFIVSSIVWMIPLTWKGYISVAFAARALVALVVLRASCWVIGWAFGDRTERLVRTTLHIGVPVASFLTLAVTLSGGGRDDIVRILGLLGVLYLAVVLYVMSTGVYYSPWDLLFILSIVAWIIPLVYRGYISVYWGTFGLVVLLVLKAGSKRLGSACARRSFEIGIPIASFLTLAATLSGGTWDEIVGVLAELGALCLALAGLYIMLVGPCSSRRRG